MKPLRCLFVSLALAASIGGCERESQVPSDAAEKREVRTVVLVSLDTWRRDTSGFLGGLDPSPTPFLDRLAAKGLVAADAMAPVPLTAPSHWSMLSGRWPWRDGVRVNGDRPRPGSSTRLAERLRRAGWRTAAFVSCAVLDQRFGFGAGFEHYDDRFQTAGEVGDVEMAERRGDLTVQAALDWMAPRSPGERVFLWVHLFDPHFPYVSPAGALPGEHGDYRGEVAFADAQLERLAAGLAQLGRPLEQSLWVALSDHGEGLREHGEDTHGLILHGATTRIPLLVAGPSVAAGRFEALASTVDVFPTILGYLSLEIPESDGVDLLRGAGSSQRALPLESLMAARAYGLAPVLGLRLEQWLWEASPVDHLWNLESDPAEERDVAAESVETLARLRERRREIGVPDVAPRPSPDAETIERLRALGYVPAGSPPGSGDVRILGPQAAEAQLRIENLLSRGQYAEAEVFAEQSVERYPRSVDLWVSAGFVSVGLENFAEAERRFRAALELAPDYTPAQLNLANALLQRGRLPEAEAGYRRVLESDPENLFGLYNLGNLLARRGRIDEAAAFWRRFQELYPEHPRAASVRRRLAQWEAEAGSR